MALQHLHLHVRDRAAARAFYAEWFRLRTVREDGEIVFMTDERAFLLALADDPAPAAMPPWFHFGFRLDSPEAVRSLHRRMAEGGVEIRKPIFDDEDFVSYRCVDRDGYVIEVYWDR